MPQKFVNTWNASTPLGQSLQNLSHVYFGGKTADEKANEIAKYADLLATTRGREANILQSNATTRLHNADASIKDDMLYRRQRSPQQSAMLAGVDDPTFARAMNFQRTGVWDGEPLDPDTLRRIQNSEYATDVGYGGASPNPHNNTQAVSELTKLDNLARAITGGPAVRNAVAGGYGAIKGDPMVDIKDHMSFDPYGAPTQSMSITPVGESVVARDKSTMRANDARARYSDARTRKTNRDGGSGRMYEVTIQTPNGPVKHMLPEKLYNQHILNTVNEQMIAPPRENPIRPNKGERETIVQITDALMQGQGSSVDDLDPAQLSALVGRAEQYFSTPGSAGYNNPQLASEQAFKDTFKNGFEDQSGIGSMISNWWNDRGNRRPRGIPTTTYDPLRPPTGAPAAPSIVTPRQSAPGGTYLAPNGRSVSIDEINSTARNRGKTPQQVIQELRLQPGGV